MKNIRFISLLLSMTFIILLCGCDSSDSKIDRKVKNDDIAVTEFEFDEYYTQYEHFGAVSSLITDYINGIEKAYIKSDKSDVMTFELDDDTIEFGNTLYEYYQTQMNYVNTGDKQLLIYMFRPFLSLYNEVANIAVLSSVASDDTDATNDFKELKKAIDNAIYTYENNPTETYL